MNVRPEIFTHPKFINLKEAVGDIAFELLGRIWGHCQMNKRGERWVGATPSYVEIVACGRPQNGKVYAALVNTGWIDEEPECIVIHGWDDENGKLVSRWSRDRALIQARQASDQSLNRASSGSDQRPTSTTTDGCSDSHAVLSYPIQSSLVPSSVEGPTERERERATTSPGEKRSARPARRPSDAEILALRTQAGLLRREIQGAETEKHLTREQREELQKNKRALAEIQARQRNGDFSLKTPEPTAITTP